MFSCLNCGCIVYIVDFDCFVLFVWFLLAICDYWCLLCGLVVDLWLIVGYCNSVDVFHALRLFYFVVLFGLLDLLFVCLGVVVVFWICV